MRFAVISDIHFGKHSRTRELSVPGEFIEDDNQGGVPLVEGLIELLKENDVKYIFIAGDMTSVGSPQEFYYCEKSIIDIANKANIPASNIICGMGNHDIDWGISKLADNMIKDTSESDVKELVKDRYQNMAAYSAQINLPLLKNFENGPVPFSGIYETDSFIAFVLNSSLFCSHDQEIPHGRLSNVQLEWFDKEFESFVDDKRKKIVLMHHHPRYYTYPSPSFDVSAIEEGTELVESAGKHGIDIIIHGHRHHPTAITQMQEGWKHPIVFLCAGSLSVNATQRANGEIPNTVHIVELTDETNEIVLYNYGFTSAMGWQGIEQSSANVPLDKKMWLGKIFDSNAVKLVLEKYADKDQIIFHWDTLEPELRYMRVEELNKEIRDFFAGREICGKFPESVAIMSTKQVKL